ncbi:DUF364 domain-containing protein [Aphanothece sacrum]|uniref:Heavy-metal chelation domain-containing protein n=1 Tax=Aphanothece sacrum FPU1 TaxID=1920663 RepID=A0A401IFS1_APHSA|nr:DUF364 domain-containing protein [Aphanothece sacrum]GBF80128.1 hypothetical protein AsFPU1_1529 [Aphanothece sacrum FPU1]GBF86034.1 hypothetical protein AsFPU3_3104 [Aphanothece sacrum FPU3]
MVNPQKIYDLLLDYSHNNPLITEVLIGLTWTMCHAEGIGLCMSPAIPTRTLSWSGTLVNQRIQDIAPWLRSWDNYQATVAMAAINAAINPHSPLLAKTQLLPYTTGLGNLTVFEHFLPQMLGKSVSVIGRYPGLVRYETEMKINVIELQPGPEDFPATASEYLLPESDWVFLTATSIPNKTFPRLVELSKNAKLVLIGPTVPWLSELADFGIDYLAGVTVTDPKTLRQTIAEGGGVRIFEQGVQYRLVALNQS